MTKCLNFTIREQKLSVGPKKGQKVFIARPTDRQRVKPTANSAKK